MFLNYQDISDYYIPNNLKKEFDKVSSYTKLSPVHGSKPYEEYNAKGELVGYFWHQGETLNLEFNIDGEITVEDDAIVLSVAGESPSSDIGEVDQRAYNIIDKISWTCTSNVNDIRTWTPDLEFTYDESCTRKVYMSAADYLKDKSIEVVLYNYRHEPIHVKRFRGKTKIIVKIDTELSASLKRGVYYCSLTVFNDNIRLPIFSNTDCILNVK